MQHTPIFVVIRDNSGEDATELEGAFLVEAEAYSRSKELREEGYEGVEVYPTVLVGPLPTSSEVLDALDEWHAVDDTDTPEANALHDKYREWAQSRIEA